MENGKLLSLHLRRDPDRGGLGDPTGAGHEPGFAGGVSAWAAVMSESGEGVEREAVLGWWGVAACVASAGVPARCGGPWARLGAWAPSLVCGGLDPTSVRPPDVFLWS